MTAAMECTAEEAVRVLPRQLDLLEALTAGLASYNRDREVSESCNLSVSCGGSAAISIEHGETIEQEDAKELDV